MGPERVLENHFRLFVEGLGGLCIKLQGQRGLPDRLVIFRHEKLQGGGMYFAEFKSPRGKVSKAQKVWIDRLTKLGIVVQVFDNLEDAVGFHKKAVGHIPKVQRDA